MNNCPICNKEVKKGILSSRHWGEDEKIYFEENENTIYYKTIL